MVIVVINSNEGKELKLSDFFIKSTLTNINILIVSDMLNKKSNNWEGTGHNITPIIAKINAVNTILLLFAILLR